MPPTDRWRQPGPQAPGQGRAKSQSPTPLWSLPSTTPRTCPVSRSTMVVIHGSCRIHKLDPGSRKNRTDRKRCSSMPSIRGLSSSTSGRVRRQASVTAARTVHHETPNAAAVSDTARPERITAATTWSRSRPVDRARRGTWTVDSNLHGAGDRNVPDPLEAPFLPLRRDNTAAGTARWLVNFDDDLAAPIGQHAGGDDAVVGQVEDAGGSVERHNGRLSQGSWSWSWLNARHTHPSRAMGALFIYDTKSIPHEP